MAATATSEPTPGVVPGAIYDLFVHAGRHIVMDPTMAHKYEIPVMEAPEALTPRLAAMVVKRAIRQASYGAHYLVVPKEAQDPHAKSILCTFHAGMGSTGRAMSVSVSAQAFQRKMKPSKEVIEQHNLRGEAQWKLNRAVIAGSVVQIRMR